MWQRVSGESGRMIGEGGEDYHRSDTRLLERKRKVYWVMKMLNRRIVFIMEETEHSDLVQ